MKNKISFYLYFLLGALLPLLGTFSLKLKIIFLLLLVSIGIFSNKTFRIISYFPLFFLLISIDYFFDLYFFSKESVFSFTNHKFLLSTVEYCSFILIFNTFVIKKDGDSSFINGVIFTLSLLSGIFLIEQGLNYNLFGVSKFWENQGREALLFTDPNAYGVFFALIFPFYLSKLFDVNNFKFGVLYFTLILVSLISASFSGSRTMLIGLAVSNFCFFILKYKISKKFYIIPIAVLAIVLSGVSYNSSYFCSFFPKSSNRICKAFDLSQVSKSLYSRAVFTKLNLELIKDYPYTGVGFNQFEEKLPKYKDRLNLSIGNWSDNPNNFYLGILSELGLIGFLFFLIGLSNLKFKLSETNIDLAKKSSIISLSIMLLTGPHFNFIEITILSAWLISISVNAKREIFTIKFLALVLLILYAVLKFPIYAQREFGFYAYEKNEFGNFQWTRKKFKRLIKCKNGTINFSFRAANPDLASKSLLLIYEIGGDKRQMKFDSYELKKLSFDCNNDLLFKGNLSRDFKPSKFFDVKDSRNLGIQIYTQ